MLAHVAALVVLVEVVPRSAAQVTWGPVHLDDSDDVKNQQLIHDLLKSAYFTGWNLQNPRRELIPHLRAEIDEFRQRVPTTPSLALAIGMAKYHFAWYKEGTSEMDTESVYDAAELLALSIRHSGCASPEISAELFFQRMCNARWPYIVMIYAELGRELASRYLTDLAAPVLERAVAAFDEMMRLPYYASRTHWTSPYDINFNEEWYPRVSPDSPGGPVWDSSEIPLARLFEENFETIAAELNGIVERGLFDRLHFDGIRAEGQDHAPEEGWRAVELTSVGKVEAGASSRWDTAACRESPKTCALLRARPEFDGCSHSSATFVRLRAGGKLKPHFGAGPKLQCHLALQADPGARFSVGNKTLSWQTGKALVIDDTHIRQEWHAGVKGEHYALQVVFCHPCDEPQRQLYSGSFLRCPAPGAASRAFVPRAGSSSSGSSSGLGAAAVPTPPFASSSSSPMVTGSAPFAAAALWAASLPDLALCSTGINEKCPPDTNHGGPNPLSAVNTWNYALNNLRVALKHADAPVEPRILEVIAELQQEIQSFLAMPALDRFGPIMQTAQSVFDAVGPWLREQPPVQVNMVPLPTEPVPKIPSDGSAAGRFAFRLSNGVDMPAIGFGTWKLEGDACYNAVRWALEEGIRHIDTAEAYGNEADVGSAIKDSGIPREQLFLATKATSVPLGMAEPAHLESIFVGQLQQLQTEYVDVYMLHASGVSGAILRTVWQGLERLHDLGRARSLGVSNFGQEALEELWSFARIKPVYLQNIYKAYKPGEQMLSTGTTAQSLPQWARSHHVTMVGYSVINSWPHLLPPLQDPHVLQIARKVGRTASQVLHRWVLQHGIAVIPKASSRQRIRENAQLLDFELDPVDMAALDGLATLSESTHKELRPPWSPDAYGLQTTAAVAPHMPTSPSQLAPVAGEFQEVARSVQCNPDLPGAQAPSFTLGGGGHLLENCRSGCVAQGAGCQFIVYYQSTGYCHMFRSCAEPKAAGDSPVVYARIA